jgi:hypothetical protein
MSRLKVADLSVSSRENQTVKISEDSAATTTDASVVPLCAVDYP